MLDTFIINHGTMIFDSLFHSLAAEQTLPSQMFSYFYRQVIKNKKMHCIM